MNTDVSIETIGDVYAHPNADLLDIVQVLGFQCVTPRDRFSVGEKIVYIRPDTILPQEEWATAYLKYAPKRVKPIRLRGEWSEGIVMPYEYFKDVLFSKNIFEEDCEDISDALNIKHYEPPVPQSTDAKGFMPYNIPKTDENRWENIYKKLPFGIECDVTLKIDGSSCTFYYHLRDDIGGVTSRSLDINLFCDNIYTAAYKKYDVAEKLKKICVEHGVSLAIRGEVYGQGIQSMSNNPHSTLQLSFAMFSVYLIDEKRYAEKGDPYYFRNVAAELGIPTVPMLAENVPLSQQLIDYYSTGIIKINGQPFEGVVIKQPGGSFKIINKEYDSRK